MRLNAASSRTSFGARPAEHERAIATRAAKITGVSVFPNPSESMPFPEEIPSPNAEGTHPFAGKLPALPTAGKGERFAALVEAARAGATLRELHRLPQGGQHRHAAARCSGARRGAVRSAALARGRRPRNDRVEAAHLPGAARQTGRLPGARELGAKLLRGGRHRGHRARAGV